MPVSRFHAFLLLALANLFWAGNWIAGRALRDAFEPASLNFWRWTVATLALAPFALPGLCAKLPLLRRHAGQLGARRYHHRRNGGRRVGIGELREEPGVVHVRGDAVA